ncbi:hypothetical protein ACFWZ4_14495 [Frateuria sp. GZRe12]|uniref:hypothetical protein n=1 Tax=Frateuria sp. GZRe12 TaxID=3351533 RepID=UPI003EDC6A41
MIDLSRCAGTVLLASVLLLSILLKLRDRRAVDKWLRDRFPRVRGPVLFPAVLGAEAALLAATLTIGPGSAGFLIVTCGVLVLSAWLFRVFGHGRGGCPCFGSASLSAGLRAEMVFLIVLVAELVCACLSMRWRMPVWLFCAFAAAVAVGFYLLSAGLAMQNFLGAPMADGGKQGAALLGEAGRGSKPLALIFLSTRCQVCMTFLKYLEQSSELFAHWIDLRLVIDGLDVTEETMFGASTIVPVPYRLLADALQVVESPTLVLWNGSMATRHRGIQACNLALSEIARVRLAAA